jgi:hypothetical protein
MSGFFEAGCTVTSKIPDIRRKLTAAVSEAQQTHLIK